MNDTLQTTEQTAEIIKDPTLRDLISRVREIVMSLSDEVGKLQEITRPIRVSYPEPTENTMDKAKDPVSDRPDRQLEDLIELVIFERNNIKNINNELNI